MEYNEALWIYCVYTVLYIRACVCAWCISICFSAFSFPATSRELTRVCVCMCECERVYVCVCPLDNNKWSPLWSTAARRRPNGTTLNTCSCSPFLWNSKPCLSVPPFPEIIQIELLTRIYITNFLRRLKTYLTKWKVCLDPKKKKRINTQFNLYTNDSKTPSGNSRQVPPFLRPLNTLSSIKGIRENLLRKISSSSLRCRK